MHLSTFITELKKLLKINLTSVESKDPEFENVYTRREYQLKIELFLIV